VSHAQNSYVVILRAFRSEILLSAGESFLHTINRFRADRLHLRCRFRCRWKAS